MTKLATFQDVLADDSYTVRSGDSLLLDSEYASPAHAVVFGQEIADQTIPNRDSSADADRVFYGFSKRCLDIFGAMIGLILLSPILLLTALLIKLSDGGQVLYVHPRVGKNGLEFSCFKFRSMVVNADQIKDSILNQSVHSDSRTFKLFNDPRVTWIGRLLRRSSLDELPQLVNVLLGDMSLVGPRPPVPREVEEYSLDDMRRLEVKPGLTCLWQVSGRSNLDFPQQLQLDLEYIERRSLLFDLHLIARTVPAVLSAEGAY